MCSVVTYMFLENRSKEDLVMLVLLSLRQTNPRPHNFNIKTEVADLGAESWLKGFFSVFKSKNIWKESLIRSVL